MTLNVCVLGAGVVGLTTALQLKQDFPTSQVSIIADKFYSETTSYGAAGIFRPGAAFRGPTQEITRRWLVNAYNYYQDVYQSAEGGSAGVIQVSGYVLASKYPEITRNVYLEELLPDYRQATEDELTICPGNWKYGSFFTTFLTDPTHYLPWMMRKFKDIGGIVTERTVRSLKELAGQFDIVVNCTGFGAKYLCGDRTVVPIRGQVIKVKAPWIKTFFYGDYDTYILPGVDAVTLGGCRQFNSYNDAVDKHDKAAIWERCTSLVPNLCRGTILKDWVGFRPHREPVRVEKEIMQVDDKLLKIVHHYGHGGYGITASPGSATYAVTLVRELLHGNYCNPHSSLL